jgi:predicted DNA-binding transcriptional regulator AlpA
MTAMEHNSSKRLRYKQAAQITGLTEVALRLRVHQGVDAPPHYRLGKRTVVFDEAELLEWMESRRVVSSKAG